MYHVKDKTPCYTALATPASMHKQQLGVQSRLELTQRTPLCSHSPNALLFPLPLRSTKQHSKQMVATCHEHTTLHGTDSRTAHSQDACSAMACLCLMWPNDPHLTLCCDPATKVRSLGTDLGSSHSCSCRRSAPGLCLTALGLVQQGACALTATTQTPAMQSSQHLQLMNMSLLNMVSRLVLLFGAQ